MALSVRTYEAKQHGQSAIVSDRRLFMDAAQERMLEDGDPTAAFVLAGSPGSTIRGEWVLRLGLSVRDGRVVQERAAPTPAPGQKQITTHQDKAVRPKGKK